MLYAVCCALHVRAGHARRALPALLVHVVDVTIDAPARYPDLFTYFNVWISFSFLSAISDGLLRRVLCCTSHGMSSSISSSMRSA